MDFIDLNEVIDKGDKNVINFFRKNIIENFDKISKENQDKLYDNKSEYGFVYRYILPQKKLTEEQYFETFTKSHSALFDITNAAISDLGLDLIIEWCYEYKNVLLCFIHDHGDVLIKRMDLSKMEYEIKLDLDEYITDYIVQNSHDVTYLKKLLRLSGYTNNNININNALEYRRFDVLKLLLESGHYNDRCDMIYHDKIIGDDDNGDVPIEYLEEILKNAKTVEDRTLYYLYKKEKYRSLVIDILTNDDKYKLIIDNRSTWIVSILHMSVSVIEVEDGKEVFNMLINNKYFSKIPVSLLLMSDLKSVSSTIKILKDHPECLSNVCIDSIYVFQHMDIDADNDLIRELLKGNWIKDPESILAMYVYQNKDINDIYDILPEHIKNFLSVNYGFLPKGVETIL